MQHAANRENPQHKTIDSTHNHFENIDHTDNAENVNAANFLDQHIPNLKERMKAFNDTFISKVMASGFVFRRVHGPVSKFTAVENTRTGEINQLMMLGSNNYLDLAVEPYVIKRTQNAINDYGVGCGGPAVLNGYTELHRQLELKIAASKGLEDALLFSSGYSANLGWSTGLLQKGDYLVYDVQSHGSLFDGMNMGDFNTVAFLHNNPKSLADRLKKIRSHHPQANIIVCVEGVYSMDGDIAPLGELLSICKLYDCMLCIDDAHGTGVMGKRGHGSQEFFDLQGQVDICMGTFSKALTATGGYVAGSKDLINYLRVYANSYIYSATIAPSVIGTVLGCMEFIDQHPERVQQLHSNTQYFVKGLNEIGFNVQSESAIIPIFISKDISMRELVYRFHQEGIFINGIEYPSVPRNKQRLRLSMMATFTQEELDVALAKFEKIAKQFQLI